MLDMYWIGVRLDVEVRSFCLGAWGL